MLFLKLLYNSLILPHLQYSILCWGSKHSQIFKLQKRALRTITLSKYNAHTEPLFKQLNLLKKDIYKISMLRFYYKYSNDGLPQYFTSMFPASTHGYETRGRYDIRHTTPKTTSAQKCFRHHFPTFINETPDIITDKIATHSPSGFANYAKRYYVNLYEPECNIPYCYVCNRHSQ